MKITFQKIIFRNILSYGNKDTEVNLSTPGLISLSGKNGCGKSSWLDAVTFALYGKPYRKIKINELVNRTNKKNLWVQLYFQQNTTDYRITRTLAPNSITIEKKLLNESEYTELDLLSATKLVQDEINKIIGIEFETFKHIVAIASSAAQSKPFLALSAGDKRKLIESVFNLEIIGEMFKVLRADKSNNKSKLLNATNTINLYNSLITQLEDQLLTAESTINTFKSNKQQTINLLLDKKQQLNLDIEAEIQMAESLSGLIDSSIIDTIKDEQAHHTQRLEKYTSLIGENNAQIKHANKILSSLQNCDICPSCNTKITDEHRTNEISAFNKIIIDSKQNISDIETQISLIKESLDKYNRQMTDINTAKNRISNIITKVESLKKTISEYESQISHKENEELDIDVSKIENMILDNKVLQTSAQQEFDCCTENEVVFEIADFLLSDNGIKTEFYNVIIPIFNKTINEYLKKFELPIIINFDHEFNYTISSVQTPGQDINYYAFSEGEKKRIDISIMLTFIRLSKSIANWQTNMLIFDEAIDSGIDTEGLTTILDTIRQISTEEQLAIFVVSHKLLENTETFDRNILIIKDNGFSKMMNIE